MKKISYILLVLLSFNACMKYDNYDLPNETFRGKIVDKDTRETVQTEIGGNGIRIRMLETSWGEDPQPYDFYCMQDGSFNNTKIFKGTYTIIPEGAFVPVDSIKNVEISGVKELNVEVEPLLRIEWVDEPVINRNTAISARVRIVRGTGSTEYQQELTDVYLFLNETPYVGYNDYDSRYSKHLTFSGNAGNAILGQEYLIETEGAFTPNRTYYVRAAARINCIIAGVNRFNYSEIKKVVVP
ncbi:MAG: DUF3823 domain-containing protein [Dysgonamonadaceae bacterium]|jgi:hypothetical protein|nr:DUF3823 domain-containing protein [Dysgonamonadaceae bacterium]